MNLNELYDYLINDIACCTCPRSTQKPADGSCKHCQAVALVGRLRDDRSSALAWHALQTIAKMGHGDEENQAVTLAQNTLSQKRHQHPTLDATVRELGERFGWVSGTKGPADIAFVVASGDDADKLSEYIKRSRS